ncbi:MBL fold metallo-hydrolase [Roseospira marina]|uniref:MBL fold metallo-hydrolase n=1 Tax=Roseospira marina TaxID=140057 RepID=A0A5M6IAA3_9PROT|nr:MBL fold metallo-hydrolase [Roseospira marina]KAA5605082.1 MBL fold metallo-hydrolase [Roseospira marina]MBB4314828.1 glyoxylase-like metal-dependent hydrolase (beta-lactamase superfamily II) [Roseospira marina]MBB5087828.1 glyoxylase-like metal-dependent hydrolase (beta-lactamase superfamily II) [Roseospira marina]
MALSVVVIPVTPFQQNCSLIWDDATMTGALVDPGGEEDRLLDVAREKGVTLEKILVTHGHLDHIGAVGALARTLGVPVEGPQADDAFWIDQLGQQARMFGWPETPEPVVPTRWLDTGDTVTVGGVTLDVYRAPGHTPGHVVFVDPKARVAFVGDVLFAGSVGRTDFPMSDPPALIRAITETLLPLGDDITFVPGHGPASTFGDERQTNPFLR